MSEGAVTKMGWLSNGFAVRLMRNYLQFRWVLQHNGRGTHGGDVSGAASKVASERPLQPEPTSRCT